MNKKYLSVAAIAVCLVGIIIVIACVNQNKFSPLDEDEIISHLHYGDDVFSDYNLTIDSYNITRRQTNEELKTDYVWLSLVASNDIFSYEADYCLTFILYNDGWLLENFECNSDEFTATHPELLTKNQADDAVSEMNFDKFTFVDRIDSNNKVTFIYNAEKTEFYLKTLYKVTLVYKFTPSLTNPWGEPKISSVESGRSADGLIGEWLYEDETCRFYVNIIDIDLSKHSITLEYELENVTLDGVMGYFTTNVSSGGVVTKDPNSKIDIWKELTWGSDKDLSIQYIKNLGGGSSMIDIMFGKEFGRVSDPYKMSEFETGSGVWVSYHWLEKIS